MKKMIVTTLTLLFLVTILRSQSSGQYPGNDIIGRGYNVFGEYANISSMKKYPIFNFSKCETKNESNFNIPSIMYLEQYRKHDIKDVKGASVQEYSRDLAESTKLKSKALFFSGSLQSNFNYNSNSTESRYFQTKMDLNLLWKISLDMRDTNELIKYLDVNFLKDLNSQKPEIVFERYGTHVITSALLGGRIDFSLSQKITSEFNSSSVETTINSKYKFISGEMNKSDNTSISNSDLSANLKLNIIGGNSQFVNDIKDNEQYKIWANGINDKPTLCGFTEESLIPIWSLAENANVKTALKNYYENVWIKKYPIPEKPITKELELVVDKVYIKNSCESAFKNYGEFQLLFFVNGQKVAESQEAKGTEGSNCLFDKMSFKFAAPTKSGETVKIELRVCENDKTGNDELTMGPDYYGKGGRIIYEISFPLKDEIFKTGFKELYKEDQLAGRYCEANVTYHLQISE